MKRLFALFVLLSSFALAEESVSTRVNFTSAPSGAEILIDGKSRGTTPQMFFDLKPGIYHVKYRLAGYVEQDFHLNVSSKAPVSHHASLEEERGLLLLKSDPEGCSIKIDGLASGETPRFISNLATKDVHKVVLSKPGYQSQVLSVRFNGREPLVREEKLILDSATIKFSTDPEGAEVTVNGLSHGATPVSVDHIPKGVVVVKFVKEGYKDEVREIRVQPGDEQTCVVALTALPGTLHLLAQPAGASFYVNGEARGKGPLSIPSLKPGEYTVRCELEGYQGVERVITIGNGASAREEFKLESTRGRIELKTKPANAQVLLDGRTVGRTKSMSASETSDVFAIENVAEGEHTLVVRAEGYHEYSGKVKVESKSTLQVRPIALKAAFIPNVEIVTDTETLRGVFKSQSSEAVVIERTPGMEYPVPRRRIRNIRYLDK